MFIVQVWSGTQRDEELRSCHRLKLLSDDENDTMILPLVFGPEFAMARIPAPVNLNSGCSSSSLYKLRDNQPLDFLDEKDCVQFLSINACSSSSSTRWIATLYHEILFPSCG